jgi:hypothetical protein
VTSLEELTALFAEMPAGHRFMLPRTRKRDLWPDPQWPAQPIDDHLSVEQRAAEWCVKHHVRVWEQQDPFALVFQKLTPTGRCTRLDPEMQDLRQHISNPAVIIMSKDTDFAALEMRCLAAMADPAVSSIVLDIECSPETLLVDPVFFERLRGEIDKPIKEQRPPPSYLKHDPTKRHSRRQGKGARRGD